MQKGGILEIVSQVPIKHRLRSQVQTLIWITGHWNKYQLNAQIQKAELQLKANTMSLILKCDYECYTVFLESLSFDDRLR